MTDTSDCAKHESLWETEPFCPWCRIKELEDNQVWLYNQGYKAGHHDTVEAGYVDIHRDDMTTYHDDVVAEMLLEQHTTKEVDNE